MWQLSLIQYLLFSENSHLRREIHTGARVILAKASRELEIEFDTASRTERTSVYSPVAS
jgi:hypothetical protein